MDLACGCRCYEDAKAMAAEARRPGNLSQAPQGMVTGPSHDDGLPASSSDALWFIDELTDND